MQLGVVVIKRAATNAVQASSDKSKLSWKTKANKLSAYTSCVPLKDIPPPRESSSPGEEDGGYGSKAKKTDPSMDWINAPGPLLFVILCPGSNLSHTNILVDHQRKAAQ